MTPSKKYLLIINPQSRGGHSLSDLATTEALLTQQGITYTSQMTQYKGHATKIAAQQGEHFDIIIALGGDGTINEIISGLKSRKPLGIIPFGSGNDFARSCHIPLNDIPAAVDIILKHHIKQVDLGMINEHYFINGIGIGFDGHTNHIAQRFRYIRGGMKYYAAIAIAFFTYKPLQVNISSKSINYQGPLFMLSLSNGCFIGNGLQLSPEACLDDQFLDYFTISKIARLRILTQFRHMLMNNGHKIKEASHGLLDTIQITSTEPIPFHFDGEALATPCKELHIKLVAETQPVIGHWDLH